jgi:hypothetical protein
MNLKNKFICGFFLFIMMVTLSSCEEVLTRTEYASDVITIYSEYEKVSKNVAEKASVGNVEKAEEFNKEAIELLDKIINLNVPFAFKDEHEKLSEICENEKSKLNSAMELLKLIQDTTEMTKEKQEKIDELNEKTRVAAEKAYGLYNQIQSIADKQLKKNVTTPQNLLG